MKKILIIVVLIFIIGLPIVGYFYLESRIYKYELLEIGEKAPYFELKTIDGEDFSLAKNEGKKTLLVFFKTNCLHCLKQLANLNFIKNKINSKLEIIVLSESNEKETREFKETFKINFPILVDDRGIIKNKYAIRGVPTLYLLDEEMNIKYRRVGLKSLRMDEKIISEFERTNKIPIQIYSDIQEEKIVIDDFKTSISGAKAKEIALKDPAVRNFVEENIYYPGKCVEIISLTWLEKQQMYKWIVQVIELPCDRPDKKANTLNLVSVEIDPISGQITDRYIMKEIPEKLYRELLYKEVVDYSFSK